MKPPNKGMKQTKAAASFGLAAFAAYAQRLVADGTKMFQPSFVVQLVNGSSLTILRLNKRGYHEQNNDYSVDRRGSNGRGIV